MIKEFKIGIRVSLWLLLFGLLFFLPTTNYQLLTTYAQSCPQQTTNPRVQEGLISTPNLSNKFGNSTATCVVGSKAAFAPYRIPSYADLKSLYFDKSKSTAKLDYSGNMGEAGLSFYLNGSPPKNLIHITGFLSTNNNIGGSQTAVVFVDGDLYFSSPMTQFTYGNGNSGIVFVVGGNVYIDPSVKRIDAVIISTGRIYTAGAGCSTSTVSVQDALTINGSLISLDPGLIIFCRTLADNSQPAEKIIQQPKYLVILRNLYADTLQKWSEIP